jgi:hypothetical protein
MKTKLVYSFVFFAFFTFGSVFQNCSNQNFLVPTSGGNVIPMSHPEVQTFAPPTGSVTVLPLIDRKGVQSILSEVFLSSGTIEPDNTAFNNLFASEILLQQHMFGRPCDVVTTGSFLDCGYNLSNLTIGMNQSSSTIREASRIQLCRRLVSHDSLFNNLLHRLGVTNQAADVASLQRAIQLFYPAWENSISALQALLGLVTKMASQGEDSQSQWRLVVATLCESPYWEIL